MSFLFEHEKQAWLMAGAKAVMGAVPKLLGKFKGAPKPPIAAPSLSSMASAASYPVKQPGLLSRAASGYGGVMKPLSAATGVGFLGTMAADQGLNAWSTARGIRDHSTGMAQGAAEGAARVMHSLDNMNPLERIAVALRGSNAFSGPAGQKSIAAYIQQQTDPAVKSMLPSIIQEAFKRRDQLRAKVPGVPQKSMFAPGSAVDTEYGRAMENIYSLQGRLQGLLAKSAPAG